MARAAARPCCKSAEPSSPGGVPTAISCSSPCATLAATSVEKRSLPASPFRLPTGSRPGSELEVAHQLQVAPPLRRAGGDDLRLEQTVEAEQRRVATQLIAHQRVSLLGTLHFQRLLEHGVEQVE